MLTVNIATAGFMDSSIVTSYSQQYIIWNSVSTAYRLRVNLSNGSHPGRTFTARCRSSIELVDLHKFSVKKKASNRTQSFICRLHASHEPQHPAYYQKLVNDVVKHIVLFPGRGIPRLDGNLRVVLDFDTNKAPSGLVNIFTRRGNLLKLRWCDNCFMRRLVTFPIFLPSSPDHCTQNIDALKRAVLEVKEFIQKVPGSTKDMHAKFQMAHKGIVAEKKLFYVQNERPALNVEDLDPIV
ncbi:hypothetical protein C8R48DRAFT_769517 [Suillus tomentosus]|nr:hypothetical protein C8R48DRAFT_769517 [Suillus tomentosus]